MFGGGKRASVFAWVQRRLCSAATVWEEAVNAWLAMGGQWPACALARTENPRWGAELVSWASETASTGGTASLPTHAVDGRLKQESSPRSRSPASCFEVNETHVDVRRRRRQRSCVDSFSSLFFFWLSLLLCLLYLRPPCSSDGEKASRHISAAAAIAATLLSHRHVTSLNSIRDAAQV